MLHLMISSCATVCGKSSRPASTESAFWSGNNQLLVPTYIRKLKPVTSSSGIVQVLVKAIPSSPADKNKRNVRTFYLPRRRAGAPASPAPTQSPWRSPRVSARVSAWRWKRCWMWKCRPVQRCPCPVRSRRSPVDRSIKQINGPNQQYVLMRFSKKWMVTHTCIHVTCVVTVLFLFAILGQYSCSRMPWIMHIMPLVLYSWVENMRVTRTLKTESKSIPWSSTIHK